MGPFHAPSGRICVPLPRYPLFHLIPLVALEGDLTHSGPPLWRLSSCGAACGLLRPRYPRPWFLRRLESLWLPISATVAFLRSLPLFFTFLLTSHSAMALARASRHASRFCLSAGGGSAPLCPSEFVSTAVALVPADTRMLPRPGLLSRHFAAPAPFWRQPLPVPPPRLVPDRVPMCVFLRWYCSVLRGRPRLRSLSPFSQLLWHL